MFKSRIRFAALGLVLLTLPAAAEGARVANFAIGEPGSKGYEHFSFWVDRGHVDSLSYSYGAAMPARDLPLKYLGPIRLKGHQGFRVRFSNGLILNLWPEGDKLRVTDTKGKYNKLFSWEYEGPVNGIGTFCTPCAQDAAEALRLLGPYIGR